MPPPMSPAGSSVGQVTDDVIDGHYSAVLVQQSRLGEISRDELAEIITDAWLTKAPKSLAKAFLAPGPVDG